MTPETRRDTVHRLLDVSADPSELLAAVLRDNADAILVVDDGVVVAANPEAAELFGTRVTRLVGMPFGHPIADGAATELELVRRGAPAVVEMRVRAARANGREIHVATLRDVTRRREQEEAARDFVEVLSHEMRTPLTAISGFADTLMRMDLPREDVQGYLELVKRQADRLARLTDELLRLAQVDGAELRPAPARVGLREAALHAAQLAGIPEVVEVRVRDDVHAHVDRDHVEEVLINLLVNADRHGAPPIEVTAEVDGHRVLLRVRDHGEGVPDEFVPRLFDRYARAREVEGSAGLGLAIAARLAAANDGAVWYRHHPERGAVFVVSLPVDSSAD